MRDLLHQARRFSSDDEGVRARSRVSSGDRRSSSPFSTSSHHSHLGNAARPITPLNSAYEMLSRRDTAEYGSSPRRQSTQNDLLGESVARRLSEAGVNRRPSAAQILTEDTDSFIVGQTVFVDGVKPGRIQYIGETKFGPGDWAGVVLDLPLGRNDGSVGKVRYFQCEPGYGVFSRLFRLTTEPIEGADEVLAQMSRYGYEIVDAPVGRRGSTGSGGNSRRGSTSVDDRRGSMDRGSISPRSGTPELRRASLNRSSPDYGVRRASAAEPRRTSLTVPERRGSATSPMGRRTPGKSPLASPRASRSKITGGDVRIEKDPAMTQLAQEARRLSMGGGANNSNRHSPTGELGGKRPSVTKGIGLHGRNGAPAGGSYRRPSEGMTVGPHSPRLSTGGRRQSSDHAANGYAGGRRQSDSPSSRLLSGGGVGRRGSETARYTDSSHCEVHRKPSAELDHAEVERRRLSESGIRRPSVAGDDDVLNEDIGDLMIGQRVWVDGAKPGRVAYLGSVHFTKGDVAGVHLERAEGKNDGSVGGHMYFQCEPRHGIFARPHRLATQPLISEYDE